MSHCLRDLKSIVRQIYTTTSIHTLKTCKNNFRTLFHMSQNNALLFLEQILTLVKLQPKLSILLTIIEEQMESVESYDSSIQHLIQKIIMNENNISSKITQNFITKFLLRFNDILDNYIEIGKTDNRVCEKILFFISSYFEQYSLGGNLTNLLGLCMKVIEVWEKIQVKQMLQSSLRIILKCLQSQNQEINQLIISHSKNHCLRMLEQKICPSYNLTVLSQLLKFQKISHNNSNTTEQFEKTILQILKQKYILLPTSLQHQRFIYKQNLINSEISDIQVKVQQMDRFIISVSEFIKTHYDQQQSSQELKTLLYQLILIDVPQCVVNIVGKVGYCILKEQNKQQNLVLLQHCLSTCIDYPILQGVQKNAEQNIVNFMFNYVEESDKEELYQIVKNLRRNKNAQQYLPAINTAFDFFKNYARKVLEQQFQYQFSSSQVTSVTNLLCYLSPYFINSTNAKQNILFFCKLLLNLNQSCESSYKSLIVDQFLKIVCVYCELLLPNNAFLVEVIEEKLVQRFPKSYQKMYYLSQNHILTKNTSKLLLERISKIAAIQLEEQIQKVCTIIVKIEQQNVKINWPSFEWVIYYQKVGVSISEKKWIVDRQALQQIQEKLKDENYAQYSNERAILNKLLNQDST